MAFLLEDGTGLALANSVAAVQEAKDFWADRGTTLTETDAEIQAALIRATDYLRTEYEQRLRGTPLKRDQGTVCPRVDATDRNGFELPGDEVWPECRDFVCQMVPDAIAGELNPNQAQQGSVTKDVIQVGPIKLEKGFHASDPGTTYEKATGILKRVLKGDGSKRLVRS